LLTAYPLISLRAAAGALFQTDLFDVFVIAVGGGAWFLNFLNFNTAIAGILTALLPEEAELLEFLTLTAALKLGLY
jgi:hypothetical protein